MTQILKSSGGTKYNCDIAVSSVVRPEAGGAKRVSTVDSRFLITETKSFDSTAFYVLAMKYIGVSSQYPELRRHFYLPHCTFHNL